MNFEENMPCFQYSFYSKYCFFSVLRTQEFMRELISLIILRHQKYRIEAHVLIELCIIKCYE
jgi:hypothetical protein